MSGIVVTTAADAAALEASVRAAAAAACDTLSALLAREPPLEVLRALKFHPIGVQPTEPERPDNLMHQVHTTFAWLAAIRAVEALLRRHPEHAPFRIDISGSGPDIVSVDGQVAAETMAVVSPVNNAKLASDRERMRAHAAAYRYVFYMAEEPGDVAGDDGGVEVLPVEPFSPNFPRNHD